MTSRSIVALNNFSIEAIKYFMAQMADPICALHTSTHVLLFSLFSFLFSWGGWRLPQLSQGDMKNVQEVFQKSRKTLSGVRTTMETKTPPHILQDLLDLFIFLNHFITITIKELIFGDLSYLLCSFHFSERIFFLFLFLFLFLSHL